MKQIINEFGKLDLPKTACAVFVLCATTAIALPAQTFTTLFSFDAATGGIPYAALVQATNGDLYGTTTEGGKIFRVTPRGAVTTLSTTSGIPYAGLTQATNGNFYGTTSYGVAGGTVFKMTPSGALTTLYTFGGPDGSSPYAGLVQATNGDLYGTTGQGGANGGALPSG